MGGIGESVRRVEDRPLLLGQGKFVSDLNLPGQIWMRVVRSEMAHARIVEIDIGAAANAPGVVSIWTGADVADIPPIDFRQVRLPSLPPYRQPILAQGIARYVGEPLALVFADDPYRAEDAADLVNIVLEECPPILAATDPPGEFAPGRSTEAAVLVKEFGDVAAAFAQAALVVSLRLAVGRHSGVPLETRGALACWNAAAGRLELHGAAKLPHLNRLAIAEMLQLPLAQLHLFEGHVGGGFGIRGELYPEDVLVCLAALRLHRPVKWIEDRREHMLAANHSRDQVHDIRAAISKTGDVLGIDAEFWVDQGAYMRTHAATVADLTAGMLTGPYRIPACRVAGHIRLTNKTPAGTYRAPGRYEGSFVRERLLDHVADMLGQDRIAIRRANLIPPGAMPFARGTDALGTEIVYDSGDYPRLLDRLLASIDYPALQKSLAARRALGEQVGLGLAMFVEKSGLGPFDDVRLTLDATGHLELITGAASVGQGIETAMAQICEQALGISYDGIGVVHGQTDRIARGMGAFASRVTVMTGSATHLAAMEMRTRLLAQAAQMLQAQPQDLELRDGRVIGGADPAGRSVAIGDVAAACAAEDGAALLSTEASFTTAHMTYPYGIHLAVVRVDAETHATAVERFVVAYDVGRAVNPMLVHGQIAGGAAQGIGGALFEEFLYDAQGQPLSTSFADYLLPGMADIPPIEILLTEDAPSPLNPLGVKGAGEGGLSGAGAAIASAIDAALDNAVFVSTLPVTPSRLHAQQNMAPILLRKDAHADAQISNQAGDAG